MLKEAAVTTSVIFTGDWSDSVKEANGTNTLIDQKVDVITCHVDSPKVVVETAEKRGIKVCGYHASQAELAPKGYLTGAEWNWEKLYPELVEKIKKGEKVGNYIRGGLKAGLVKMSPYGPSVTEQARKDADAAREVFEVNVWSPLALVAAPSASANAPDATASTTRSALQKHVAKTRPTRDERQVSSIHARARTAFGR